MRKFIVIVTLLYAAVVATALGYLSDGFREPLALGDSVIVTTLVLGLAAAVVAAVLAYWKHNEWLAVVLVAIVLGSGWYVGKTHHAAYGEWLPSRIETVVESSDTARLNAKDGTLSYRLELHNPGTVTHREYLIVTRGGKDQRIRLPIFGESRSGYVSPKTPSDWILLHPTEDAEVYRAETGRFLFVRKSFKVNLRTGKAVSLGAK